MVSRLTLRRVDSRLRHHKMASVSRQLLMQALAPAKGMPKRSTAPCEQSMQTPELNEMVRVKYLPVRYELQMRDAAGVLRKAATQME